jgi:hypothetical protein
VVVELVRGRAAGGVPLSAKALLSIAEEDDWQPGGAALALGHPTLWADPRRGNSLLTEVLPVVAKHRADALPDWLYHVSLGIGYAHPDPRASAAAAAGALAIAAYSAAPSSPVVRDILAAIRLGLGAAATDPEISVDPLSGAANLLFGTLSEILEPATATQYVNAVFSDLEPEDRALVARAILL